MNTVELLFQQHPEFAPGLKLKGMLLEDSGHTAEAAGAYEQALKLAPNDGDLLLRVGIAKLTSGKKEEAIRLLEHCVRVTEGYGGSRNQRDFPPATTGLNMCQMAVVIENGTRPHSHTVKRPISCLTFSVMMTSPAQ